MNEVLQLVSKHRSAIMGFAILWIMLFHLPVPTDFSAIDFIKSIGYGGVDTNGSLNPEAKESDWSIWQD